MIRPTWQDRDRRVIYVPSKYARLNNPLGYATNLDHGTLIRWNEACITVQLDGLDQEIDCQGFNLFWEDKNGDFDEMRIFKNETEQKNHN